MSEGIAVKAEEIVEVGVLESTEEVPGETAAAVVPEETSEEAVGDKRPADDEADEDIESKKARTEIDVPLPEDNKEVDNGPAPVPPSKEGLSSFNDNDVLSGRGGGTNVHPGNRNFRDLINLHRRAYLKARKNDKPAISRAIVRSIRETNGRFLKKDEKTGLWFEVGDDAAREKTSQALRQRAPEMRKLLFDTEREEARAAAEEHMRQQRMIMGMGNPATAGGDNQNGMPAMQPGMFPNPAFFAMANKSGMAMPGNMPQGQDPYSQMFSAAILGGNMNRFANNNGNASAPSNGTGV